MKREDIDAVEQALGAIRFFADYHGTAPEGQRHFQDVLKVLRGDTSNLFRTNIADAIDAYLANRRVQAIPRGSLL
jgi:hypothetical protein